MQYLNSNPIPLSGDPNICRRAAVEEHLDSHLDGVSAERSEVLGVRSMI